MAEVLGTKQQLIEATIEAIATGGESSVRMSSVATAVGVKEPSVYHFFKNREDLVEAAQIERYRRSYTEMVIPFEWAVEMSSSREEFEDTVRKLFKAVFSPERILIRSTRMNVLGSAQTNPAIAKAVVAVNHEVALSLAKILSTAQSRSWLTNDVSAVELSYWLIGMVNARIFPEMNQNEVDLGVWDTIGMQALVAVFWPTTAK